MAQPHQHRYYKSAKLALPVQNITESMRNASKNQDLTLDGLPRDILHCIFKYLGWQGIQRLAMISKTFVDLVSSESATNNEQSWAPGFFKKSFRNLERDLPILTYPEYINHQNVLVLNCIDNHPRCTRFNTCFTHVPGFYGGRDPLANSVYADGELEGWLPCYSCNMVKRYQEFAQYEQTGKKKCCGVNALNR
ncbi:hypothetical protein LTR66_014560 [Elasticomyces elasticus]|nr:hypothetical protein LTR66_014560 [Elasticomyces elasticus]